jgi:hypothetical protein
MAQYLVITVFWGIGLFISSTALKSRIIAFTFTFLSFTTLLLTFSRGAIISTIIGGIFFAYLYVKTIGVIRFNKRKAMAGLILLIIIFAVGIVLADKLTDGKTFAQIMNMYERADSYRLMLWEEGIDMFFSSPITGFGLGNYTVDYHIYVHNEFLQMLVETGIIGTAGFLIFLFFTFRVLWRQYVNCPDIKMKILHLAILTSIFATLIQSMVSFNLHSAVSSFFFFIGLGILCANIFKKTNTTIYSKNRVIRNFIILLIPTLLSVWAVQGEYKKIMGHYSFSQALLFQKQNDNHKSLSSILKAIMYQPYNSKYYRQAGEIYLNTGEIQIAKKYFKKAKKLSSD